MLELPELTEYRDARKKRTQKFPVNPPRMATCNGRQFRQPEIPQERSRYQRSSSSTRNHDKPDETTRNISKIFRTAIEYSISRIHARFRSSRPGEIVKRPEIQTEEKSKASARARARAQVAFKGKRSRALFNRAHKDRRQFDDCLRAFYVFSFFFFSKFPQRERERIGGVQGSSLHRMDVGAQSASLLPRKRR